MAINKLAQEFDKRRECELLGVFAQRSSLTVVEIYTVIITFSSLDYIRTEVLKLLNHLLRVILKLMEIYK